MSQHAESPFFHFTPARKPLAALVIAAALLGAKAPTDALAHSAHHKHHRNVEAVTATPTATVEVPATGTPMAPIASPETNSTPAENTDYGFVALIIVCAAVGALIGGSGIGKR